MKCMKRILCHKLKTVKIKLKTFIYVANDNCVIESEAFTKLKIYSNLCLILEYESIPTSAAFNSSACVLYTLILWCDLTPKHHTILAPKALVCVVIASSMRLLFGIIFPFTRPLLFVFVVQGRVPF